MRENLPFLCLAPSCYYGKDSAHLISGEKRPIKDLKVGDRVLSIDPITKEIVEDEIVLMMHNQPNDTGKTGKTVVSSDRVVDVVLLALFYKFQTTDGHEVSLTGAHNIPIYDPQEKRVKIVRSEDVTMRHQLILQGRMIGLRNITTHSQQGFYSPLTLSSYLMVNQILTHVFSDK